MYISEVVGTSLAFVAGMLLTGMAMYFVSYQAAKNYRTIRLYLTITAYMLPFLHFALFAEYILFNILNIVVALAYIFIWIGSPIAGYLQGKRDWEESEKNRSPFE